MTPQVVARIPDSEEYFCSGRGRGHCHHYQGLHHRDRFHQSCCRKRKHIPKLFLLTVPPPATTSETDKSIDDVSSSDTLLSISSKDLTCGRARRQHRRSADTPEHQDVQHLINLNLLKTANTATGSTAAMRDPNSNPQILNIFEFLLINPILPSPYKES